MFTWKDIGMFDPWKGAHIQTGKLGVSQTLSHEIS